MTDEESGYKKPPRHSQFKPGNNANPLGRGAKKLSKPSEVVNRLLHTLQKVSEGGNSIQVTRQEAMVKRIGDNALRGDIDSARLLLQLRKHVTAVENFQPIIFYTNEVDDMF